ncbi:MAG: hypothetical protein NZ990_08335, partial [Myxococcota bacterium]|nr:hypothetical protein [Myxococcota bacterium]
MSADFAHFVQLGPSAAPLSADESGVLAELLRYGPREAQAEVPRGKLALVVPRIGTVSPWSSKATDIAKICGLEKIERVERGIAYWLEGDIDAATLDAVLPLVHDRMTQAVLGDFAEAERLFGRSDPQPL